MINIAKINLGGGLDAVSPATANNPAMLINADNIECKRGGGYRRILGYSKFDTNEISGEGNILGVWMFNGKVYAFRNVTGGATATMWESTGSGWTAKKTLLAPGGSYEFVNYSFAGTEKMYGVSGTHKAFEWDGTTWTDLTTGMTSDTPSHLIAHRKHLFLSFGRSVQHSGLGVPTSWTLATGASEMVVEGDVTGFSKLSGGVLGIFTETNISILSGSSTADWAAEKLSEHGSNAGAVVGSIQQMGGNVRFMDSRGIADFQASQKFGDFEDALISRAIAPLIEGKGTKVTASTVVRGKSQYRIFFNDSTGFVFTFDGERVMISRMNMAHTVHCIVNGEDNNGVEKIYFGSTDGYVRQMESGNSFDGSNIVALIDTAYSNMGAVSRVKRFRRLRADIQSSGNVSVKCRADYRIGAEGLPKSGDKAMSFPKGQSPLGSGATLGATYLGAVPINEGRVALEGRGDWVSFRFFSDSASDPVWDIDGITVEYLHGRSRR